MFGEWPGGNILVWNLRFCERRARGIKLHFNRVTCRSSCNISIKAIHEFCCFVCIQSRVPQGSICYLCHSKNSDITSDIGEHAIQQSRKVMKQNCCSATDHVAGNFLNGRGVNIHAEICGELFEVSIWVNMQNYKCLREAVTICAILVNKHTQTDGFWSFIHHKLSWSKEQWRQKKIFHYNEMWTANTKSDCKSE